MLDLRESTFQSIVNGLSDLVSLTKGGGCISTYFDINIYPVCKLTGAQKINASDSAALHGTFSHSDLYFIAARMICNLFACLTEN